MTTTARMLSDEERRVMKHALGWPKFYRNYYAADTDSRACSAWNGLVSNGFAREFTNTYARGLRLFAVTKDGMGELVAAEVEQ